VQTATRAERAGADDEVVLAALCHDIGKAISEPNHPAVAAALLRPYVRDEVVWMIEVHQDFQGRHYYGYLGKDPDARDRHRGHEWLALAERFADEWDQRSFDPAYNSEPLEHFEPLVRRLLAAPQRL
jgi:predicted HD phosphohydrolase